ncbi:MAG TPA: molecular chaperone TorD family protein [Terriglobales bacterium]|nr:molecular chaperone TorD family protein [Terriglobales bacterium]
MDYAGFADWLDYPAAAAPPPQPALAQASPVVQGLLAAFATAAAALPAGRLEEVYTQTFDLQPECTLNLGHHLFGEDWKRSLFLIELKALFARHSLDPGHELPDHLCWLLRLLAVAPPDPELQDLRATCLLPALRALSLRLQDSSNPYQPLLQALYLVLSDEVRP